MQEINAWLRSGKDFETGKALYIKFGKNTFFKSLLNTQGATPYNIKKLGAELKVLALAPPAITHDAPPTSIVTPAPPPAKVQEAEKAETPPPSLKLMERYMSLKELLKQKYRQMERNMAVLDFSDDQNFLHLTAKQILSLNAQIGDIHDLIDYFDEHGTFPFVEVIEEIIRTPAQEVQLLRQSNSKAKRRIENGKCRDIKKTKELIEINNKRISELLGKDEQCL